MSSRLDSKALGSGCGKMANNYNNLVKGSSMRQKLQNSKGYAELLEFLLRSTARNFFQLLLKLLESPTTYLLHTGYFGGSSEGF